MTLIELQTFLAIVDTGSLIRASEQLNVTQSTVTARLQTLERELGNPLIVRKKSGASLTGAGQRLHRYALTITGLWQQARQEIGLPDALSAVCNLACNPDLWAGMAQGFFDYVRTRHPHVALSIWQADTPVMTGWLKDGLADVVITHHPNAREGQTLIELPSDELILVSTQNGTATQGDRNYVYIEAGDDFGSAHAAAFAEHDPARISFGATPLGLEHILTHGGSAYAPRRIVQKHLDAEVLYEQKSAPKFQRACYLICNDTARSAWPWFDDALQSMITGLTDRQKSVGPTP